MIKYTTNKSFPIHIGKSSQSSRIRLANKLALLYNAVETKQNEAYKENEIAASESLYEFNTNIALLPRTTKYITKKTPTPNTKCWRC